MSQRLHIPIAFEFRPQPASWKIITVETQGRTPLAPFLPNWLGSAVKADLKEKTEDLADTGMAYVLVAKVAQAEARNLVRISWRALPEPLRSSGEERHRGHVDLKGVRSELLICAARPARSRKQVRASLLDMERPRIQKYLQADAWEMRTEFLRLKPSTKDLVCFLTKWGVWGQVRRSYVSTKEHLLGDTSFLYLLPSDVWDFQGRCQEALSGGAARKWLAGSEIPESLTRAEYPHFLWLAETCKQAICMTITIDLLRKVKFRLCARHDCNAPFPIKSRHRREYCCYRCAHLVSVRKQRRP